MGHVTSLTTKKTVDVMADRADEYALVEIRIDLHFVLWGLYLFTSTCVDVWLSILKVQAGRSNDRDVPFAFWHEFAHERSGLRFE